MYFFKSHQYEISRVGSSLMNYATQELKVGPKYQIFDVYLLQIPNWIHLNTTFNKIQNVNFDGYSESWAQFWAAFKKIKLINRNKLKILWSTMTETYDVKKWWHHVSIKFLRPILLYLKLSCYTKFIL